MLACIFLVCFIMQLTRSNEHSIGDIWGNRRRRTTVYRGQTVGSSSKDSRLPFTETPGISKQILQYDSNNKTDFAQNLYYNSVPMYQNMESGPSCSKQHELPGFNWGSGQMTLDTNYLEDFLDEPDPFLKEVPLLFKEDLIELPEHVLETEPSKNATKYNSMETIQDEDIRNHAFISVDRYDYCRECYRKQEKPVTGPKHRYNVATKCKQCRLFLCKHCFQKIHKLDSLPIISTPQSEIIPDEVLRTHKYIKFSDRYNNCRRCYNSFTTRAEKRKNRRMTKNKCQECCSFLCPECFQIIHKLESLPKIYEDQDNPEFVLDPEIMKTHTFIRAGKQDYCRECYSKQEKPAQGKKHRYNIRTKCKECDEQMCPECFQIIHKLESIPTIPLILEEQEVIPDEILRTHTYIRGRRDTYTNCHNCYQKYNTREEKQKHRRTTRNKCLECKYYLCEQCFKDIHKLDSLPKPSTAQTDEVFRTHKYIRGKDKFTNCSPCWHKSIRKRKATRNKCQECGNFMCKECFQIIHMLENLPTVYTPTTSHN